MYGSNKSGKRQVTTVAALAVAIVLCAGADTAVAKGKRRREAKKQKAAPVELLPPDAAADQDASGRIRVKEGRNGTTLVVKVRDLSPRTDYELRGARSDQLLGTVRTNKKGAAKVKLNLAGPGGGAKRATDEDLEDVEVVEAATGDPVLEGDMPGDDGTAAGESEEDDTSGADAEDPVDGDASLQIGYGSYGRWDDFSAFASLISDPLTEAEFFSISLDLPTEGRRPADVFYEYHRDTLEDGEFPLGADSVADLAGRAFEIRDADDAAVISGDLPELEEFEVPEYIRMFDESAWEIDYEIDYAIPAWMLPEEAEDAAVYTLFIADETGELTDVGDLVGYELEEFWGDWENIDFGDFDLGDLDFDFDWDALGDFDWDAIFDCPPAHEGDDTEE